MKTKRRKQHIKLHLVTYFLLLSTVLFGQCPDRTVVYNRILELRDQNIGPQEQLNELIGMRDKMKGCYQPGDTLYAFLLQRLGVAYFNLLNYTEAIKITSSAIQFLNSSADSSSSKFLRLSSCYANLGYYYDALKLDAEKQAVNDSSIRIAFAHNVLTVTLLGTISDRVNELFLKGDYSQCVQVANLAERQAADLGFGNSTFVRRIAFEKVNALVESYELETAQKELSENVITYEQSNDSIYMGLGYIQQGNIFTKNGQLQRALDFFNKAYVYCKAINSSAGCASALNGIGFLYADKLHDNKSALIYYQQALKYNQPGELPSLLDNLANLYASTGQFDSSLRYYDMGFEQVMNGLREPQLHDHIDVIVQSKLAEYVLYLALDKADIWLKRYQTDSKRDYLDSALAIYRRTDQVLDKLRKGYAETLSKLFWRDNTHRLFENAIEASQLAGNLESAFYFFEKSRSAILNEALVEQRWLGKEELNKESSIKRKLLLLQRSLAITPDSLPIYKSIQQQAYAASQELIQLQRDIKAKNPLYYQNFLDTTSIRLSTLQSTLQANDQWMVEVFTGDKAIYVLTITHNSGWLKKLDKAEYEKLAQSYINYLQNTSAMNAQFQDFQETSGHLFKMIFGLGNLPAGRLIISQDGHYFPFEALVSSAGVSGPHYMVEDYPMSYAYSARYMLSNLALASGGDGQPFLGYAPVQFKNADLAALPASDESLKKLGKLFGDSKLLTGPAATRTSFMDQFSQYNIIQLYTHGADSSAMGEPAIYFADSALYLSDLIGDSKPLTRLIVLSACETGTGKLYRGEGVFSFNRGFAAIGIPASITNLWSVNNEATYRITELFYQYLSKGIPTDVALQKAKVDFLHTASGEMKLPNYWAAAILAGNVDQFKIEKGLNWTMILLGAGGPLLLVILIAWYMNRKRRAVA